MSISECLTSALKTFRKENGNCEIATEIADDLNYSLALSEPVALAFLKIWAGATDHSAMTEKDMLYHQYSKQIHSLYLEEEEG